MSEAPKTTHWADLIGRVTTPIAFFTLVCLVAYAILGAVAASATGEDRTILVVGMLVGLLILIVMVFVLARSPQGRSALTGAEYRSPARLIHDMDLSGNDIRFLVAVRSGYGRISIHDVQGLMVGQNIMPLESRIKKLVTHGLVERHGSEVLTLTEEGRLLGDIFGKLARAVVKSPENRPFPTAR